MQQKIHRVKKILISFLICCVMVLQTPALLLAEETAGETPAVETEKETADAVQEPEPSEEPTPQVTVEPTPTSTPTPTPDVTEEPEISAEPTPTSTPTPTPQEKEETVQEPQAQESEQGKAPVSGSGWKQSGQGEYRYYYNSHSYFSDGWHDVEGRRFYFDESGYIQTGWLKIGKATYYLKKTGEPGVIGAMLTGWQNIGSQRFYFKASGASKGQMFTGWQNVGNYRYYFKASGGDGVLGSLWKGWLKQDGKIYFLKRTGDKGIMGRLLTGWQNIDSERFYFKQTGASKGQMFIGWQNVGEYRYYFKASGTYGVRGSLWKGWLKQNDQVYYLKQTGEKGIMGRLLTGWQNIGGKTFYFKQTGDLKGAMFQGFQNIDKKTYYFSETGTYGTKGYLYTGWREIDKITYYFEPEGAKGVKGQMATGWTDIGKYRFYFMQTGEYKGKMLTGFQSIAGTKYFFKRTGADGIKGAMLKGAQSIDGVKYFFDEKGRLEEGYRTIKGLIANAMKPMGYTLYIWGGGHDSWSGGDAVRYGVNPHWKTFFDSQGSDYTYTKYRENEDGEYYYGYGLDCSGFVGWTVYNTIYTKTGQNNCTTTSGATGELYADRGWGSYKEGFSSPSFRPGDVVGYDGHVWMILGKCSDGSYVVMHSSPQGVKLSGTVTPSTGNSDSKAVQLANRYMDKYFSAFTDKFPSDGLVCGNTYLEDSKSTTLYRFRWSLGGSGVMDDPDGYVNMSAEEILEDLFC